VTVYRLITKGTIEERILKRAKQKHAIQSLVIAGGKFQQDQEVTTQEVVSWLLDDDEVDEKIKQMEQTKASKKKSRKPSTKKASIKKF